MRRHWMLRVGGRWFARTAPESLSRSTPCDFRSNSLPVSTFCRRFSPSRPCPPEFHRKIPPIVAPAIVLPPCGFILFAIRLIMRPCASWMSRLPLFSTSPTGSPVCPSVSEPTQGSCSDTTRISASTPADPYSHFPTTVRVTLDGPDF